MSGLPERFFACPIGPVVAGLVTMASALVLAADAGLAASGPFGVGVPEQTMPIGGPFGEFFAYVALKQSQFYRALTEAVGALKSDGSAFWLLAGLSFLYGIFHAAGPGHGKAILSSYMFATEEAARRGVVLALASALAQAVTAIVLVTIAATILGLTSIEMTQTTRHIEIGSYVLVCGLGAWLVWRKLAGGSHHAPGAHHDHGHAHHPDPAALTGHPLSLRGAWSVILAIGLRPCTGALIVLVFALSQGLFLAGIVSTLVMALGTAITVALLATLAVGAKGLAVKLAGGHSSKLAIGVHRIFEIAGAAAVLVLGLVLLTAALGWGGG